MSPHPRERGRPLILVAEDDPTARLLLKTALAREGFVVEEAANGAEAVERFLELRPDLAVVDIVMPELDGFEVCGILRARPEGETTPLLVLTGLNDVESIRRAYEAGATDFATKPVNWMVLAHRIRHMLRAQSALVDLRRSEARLAIAQRIARLGHWEWDAATDRVAWSPQVHEILGTDPERFEPSLEAELSLLHPEDRQVLRQCRQAAQQGMPYALDLRVDRGEGGSQLVHEQVELVKGDRGEVVGLSGTLQDVTERRDAEARILFLARHDPLTELPNRSSFRESVASSLPRLRRHGRGLAVLLVDIDQFKRFNDTLGHRECDQLLRELAGRLRACLRSSDPLGRDLEPGNVVTLARPGGDEFLAALPDIEGAPEAARVAQRILEAAREPFRVGGQDVFITASIGISLFPQDGDDAETLITNAASALSHAPERSWGAYRFFDQGTHAAALHRVSLEGQLRRALEREELRLHYQPLFDARTKAMVGLEALARWPHAERGMISPGEFIPLAEETGLIEALGDWALRAACGQVRRWRDAGYAPPVVAINISARQFRQPELATAISRALEANGLEPSCLELEVTESVLMGDSAHVVATLKALKSMGLRIAVDDFGTGYSSLAYLRRFPLDRVKIDRSFVSEVVGSADAAAIASAILALAQSLRLGTVAEGVETEEQASFLREHGCEVLQGFLLARPTAPGEIERLMLKAGAAPDPIGPRQCRACSP